MSLIHYVGVIDIKRVDGGWYETNLNTLYYHYPLLQVVSVVFM